MSFGKLGKQLRREMTANPKKAAILGLLGVVALYFWAPLMAGWFSKDAKPVPNASATKLPAANANPTLPAPSEPSAPAVAPSKAKEPQSTWQDLVDWIEADPRTKPAGPLLPKCNPFLSRQLPDVQVRKEELQPIVRDVTPRAANLVLTSTVVGSGLRVARINGKSYRPGDTVEIKPKTGQKLEYTIAEIEARSVLLERLGKRYELKIQTPRLPGTIELAF